MFIRKWELGEEVITDLSRECKRCQRSSRNAQMIFCREKVKSTKFVETFGSW